MYLFWSCKVFNSIHSLQNVFKFDGVKIIFHWSFRIAFFNSALVLQGSLVDNIEPNRLTWKAFSLSNCFCGAFRKIRLRWEVAEAWRWAVRVHRWGGHQGPPEARLSSSHPTYQSQKPPNSCNWPTWATRLSTHPPAPSIYQSRSSLVPVCVPKLLTHLVLQLFPKGRTKVSMSRPPLPLSLLLLWRWAPTESNQKPMRSFCFFIWQLRRLWAVPCSLKLVWSGGEMASVRWRLVGNPLVWDNQWSRMEKHLSFLSFLNLWFSNIAD